MSSTEKQRVSFVLNVTFTGGAYSAREAAEKMRQAVTEYLTSAEMGLIEAYGPAAGGGYDGPVIIESEVSENGLILAHYSPE